MRTIVSAGAYKSAYNEILGKCQEPKDLKKAMSILFWALTNNADDYPLVTGFNTLRVAKTNQVGGLAPLRMIFKIKGQEVHLTWLEFVDSEEFRGPPIL